MSSAQGDNFFRREKLFIFALLFVIGFLIFVPRTPVEEPAARKDGVPTQEELMEAWSAGDIPAGARRLLTGVMALFAAILVSGILLNANRISRGVSTPNFAGVSVPWGLFPPIKIAVYTLFALILFQSFEAFLAGVFPADYPRRKVFLLIRIALFQNAVVLALVLLFFRQSGHSISRLNLNADRFLWGFKRALKSYAAFFPVLILILIGSHHLNRVLGVEPSPQPLVSRLLEERGFALFWLGVIAVFLAPLVEEIYFRGVFYPALKKWIKLPGAMMVSALLFSLVHLEPAGLIPIFALGVLLAWSYEKTRELMVPIMIHAIHNALVLIYSLAIIKVGEGIG